MTTFQIHCRDAAVIVRSSQELSTSTGDDRHHVDHIGGRLFTDRTRNQLHRQAKRTSDAVHLLQRRLSHLLVDGVLLRPLRHHDRPLRQNIPRHPPSRAQDQDPRAIGVVGGSPASVLRRRLDDAPSAADDRRRADHAATAALPAGGGDRRPSGRLFERGRRRAAIASAASGQQRRRRYRRREGRRRRRRRRSASTGAANTAAALWRIAEKRRQFRM